MSLSLDIIAPKLAGLFIPGRRYIDMRRDKEIIGYMYIDTEQAVINKVIKHIEYFHMAGAMVGGACDKGYCECPKIIDSIKEEFKVE